MPARLAAVLFLALPMLAPARPPAPTDPMAKLETAIPHGIKLLEAKKHAEFLKAFVEPEQLKSIVGKADLETFAKGFAEKLAEPLLIALKEVKDAKPRLEDEGKKAFFVLKNEVNGNSSLVFRLHGMSWRIQQ